MMQKQRNIIFTLISYKKFKHVILVLWIICIILLLNGNEKVIANNCIYKNFQSDFKAKKNYEKSPLTINYFPFITKLPTYNLALLTKQDSCPTGHEADVWVLGNKGLNWKKGNPAIDSGFRFTPIFGEAYTSYCDKNGELLIFATNMRVYNKYAEVIENRSFFPFGGPSSFMNLLLPAPGSDSLFYIFYPDMASNGVDSFPHSLHYDLIDITANNGRGKYLSKENLLLSTSSERIECIRHCNGRDWWVIAQNALTDSFHVWSLTSSGLIPTAQLYDSGNKNKENKYVIRGDLKSSHSGAYLAEATVGLSRSYPWINSWNENSSLEVHRFDPSTGSIYGGINITVDSLVDFFSAEFSSDDRILYSGHPMTQFDISSFDPIKISTSAFSFDNYYSYIPILGKNQELYSSNGAGPFNFWFSNYLGHVKYPRRRGNDAIFKDLYLNLGDSANIQELPPHFAQSIRFPYKAYIQAAFLQCQDSILKIHLLDPCPHEDAEWSLIDGGEIVGYGQTRDTIFLRYSEENEYHIAVRYAAQCGFKTDTVDIRVKACDCTNKINGIPLQDTSLCKGSDYELRFQSTYDYVKVNGRYFHPIDTIKLLSLVRDTFLQFRLFNFYECDTVMTQHIHIYNPSPPTADTISLCYGDSAWINGKYYSAVSKVELKYKVIGGCDSVHTTFLDYSEEPTITFQNFRICAGDSVEVNGKIFTRDTFFTYKYLNVDGCDSFVFKPRVIVYPTISPSQSTIFICKDDSIRFKQLWYKTGDRFNDTLQNNNGCDSIIQYNILPSETDTTSVRHLLCIGDSILLLGKKWGDPQTLFEVLQSSRGCNDSLIMHDIRLLPAITPTMRQQYICNGDSIFINNQWIKSAQRIETKLKSFTGCDSIIMYDIKLYNVIAPTIRQHYICNGDSIFINNQWIKSAQRIETKLKSFTGCDSIIMHEIKLYPDIVPTMREHYICNGDSIFIYNQWIKSAQRIETKLKSFTGCDSIIMHEIKIYPTITPTMHEHYICNGDSIFINNQWIKSEQRIETKLKSCTGCDSIIMHEIKLYPAITPTMSEHYICNGDSIFINNQWIKSEQIIETKLKSFTGCDSILQDNIIIKPLLTREIQFYICYGDSVQVLGSWYDEEIKFDQRISSSNPALCDSLIEYQIIQYEDIYVDLPQSIEIEEGSTVTLTSSFSPNAKTFRWTPSQDLSCTDCPNPICISSIDQIYYIEVSDEFGCISRDSIQVIVVKKSGEFFFPNAFSPNADGLNDLWIPVASSAQLNLISLHIYSRWGEQVYSCTSSCKGWDGKMDDQVVNPGVYVYHMVLRDERGDRKEVNGEFTLLR